MKEKIPKVIALKIKVDRSEIDELEKQLDRIIEKINQISTFNGAVFMPEKR